MENIELDSASRSLALTDQPCENKDNDSVPMLFFDGDSTSRRRKQWRLMGWRSLKSRIIRSRRGWHFGMFAGVYASLFVLLANMAPLIRGCFTRGGFKDGIGTIAVGHSKEIKLLSTAYHVLINILSPVLLTSSNYSMQILCAPTRKEIDAAHGQGRWLDIGLMSLHNLTSIGRRRAILWFLLGFSSIPLHIFYNSAVFDVVQEQDFVISFLNVPDVENNQERWAGMKNMSNQKWTKTYSIPYPADYSNLHLVLDRVSLDILLDPGWVFSMEKPVTRSCGWMDWPVDETNSEPKPLQANLNFTFTKNTVTPGPRFTGNRAVFTLSSYRSSDRKPPIDLPIATNHISNVTLCTDKPWLQNYPFPVAYALAEPGKSRSKLQISLIFMMIVIACNTIKTMAIFHTIRMCSSGHIITSGDAVASFLQRPDPLFSGKCLLDRPAVGKADRLHSTLHEREDRL